MGDLLNNFSSIISDNIWLALLMSFIAGIAASFSPCVLSTIPLVVGYVGEAGVRDKRTAFKYSLVFSIGVVMTFTALGIIVAVIGQFINLTGKWWYLILGAIMLLVGLQLIGVIGETGNTCKVPNRRKGILGAFFLGIVGGALSSPCATPVMAAILAYVAQQGNIVLGAAMLLLYSIGHSLLVLLAGTSVGFVQQLSMSSKTMFIGKVLKIFLGIIALIIGLYLLYLGF